MPNADFQSVMTMTRALAEKGVINLDTKLSTLVDLPQLAPADPATGPVQDGYLLAWHGYVAVCA